MSKRDEERPGQAKIPIVADTVATVIAARRSDATGSTPSAVTDASSTPKLVDPKPERVERTDRYEVSGELGAGGMGEVFACIDHRIGRQVAMKCLRGGEGHSAPTANAQARFIREVRIQGQLEHPAIVPVYDVGVTVDGRAYFTMKRVRGRTLRDAIRARRSTEQPSSDTPVMPLRRLLGLFEQAVQAVAYAHARGVIHRDLKPENIMFGGYGEVYVLDWGVAKTDTTSGDTFESDEHVAHAIGTESLTMTGHVVGTAGYMSPEQANALPIDARADVYALGAILFEILAGEPLHHVKGARAKLESTIRGVDGHPRSRTPDREIAPELDAICARATSLDPGGRFDDGGAFHQALERFLNDERDVELRRTIASEHATRARALADEALTTKSDALERRKQALAEAGRALALDPANGTAQMVVADLFTRTPVETPAEVVRALADQHNKRAREMIRGGGLGMLGVLGMLPLCLWLGVRDTRPLVGLFGGVVVLALASIVAARARVPSTSLLLSLFLVSSLVAATAAAFFGPMMIVPGYAALNVFAFAMVLEKRRYLLVLIGAIAVFLPAGLAALGVIPQQYEFSARGLTIVPWAISFPPGPTYIFLSAAAVAMLALPLGTVGRFRSMFGDMERELFVNRWQMNQLIPRSSASIRPGG